jgi:hypothetical protein
MQASILTMHILENSQTVLQLGLEGCEVRTSSLGNQAEEKIGQVHFGPLAANEKLSTDDV